MLYGEVAGVSKPVSRLVQGTMVLTSEHLDAGFEFLDAVFEHGCNTFDTAHVYGGGDCERVLGHWMQERENREQIVVLAKGAHFNQDRNRVTPFDITSDLHDSLARLKTDYVDLYLLHRDDPAVDVGPIVEVLNEHQRAGKVHAFGGSNWSHERIAAANAYAEAHGLVEFTASSPQFSLAGQVDPPWPGCISIGGREGAPARAWYVEHAMPVLCWSSLARGFLSGQFTRQEIESMAIDGEEMFVRCHRNVDNLERLDRAAALGREKGTGVPQIALAYLLHQEVEAFPLVGSQNAEEFRANAEACEVTLTPEELAWLNLESDTR
jgi:aryl-alcohol dehydrogenase-like predicted oxidoreductase